MATTSLTRDRHGRYDRDPGTAADDAEAARLRSRGLEYRQIASKMNCSTSTAYERVQRALRNVPVEAVNELRQIEAERIDRVIARLWDIVDAHHPVVSYGAIMKDDDGNQLADDGPVLAALTGILRASAEKRKLFGLDAPTRQTVTVITEDATDAAIRQLEDDLAAMDAEEQESAGVE